MAKKSYPLSEVYGLLEPGPVVMVTTEITEDTEKRKKRYRASFPFG